MKNCPQCHQVFDDDNDFCPNDGTPLALVSGQSQQFTPTQVVHRSAPNTSPPASSPWLYLIIGCLATALVGVGLYVYLSADRRNADHEQASVGSPSPSIAETSTTQTVTPPTPIPIPTMAASAPAAANPSGTWSGDWSTASGAYYALQVNLDSNGGNDLSGQIVWTLRRTPRPDKQYKVGMSATEYVRGRFDPASGSVTLKGQSKNDPGGLLVMLDDYRLNISSDSRRLAGKAKNGGKWNGIVNLSR